MPSRYQTLVAVLAVLFAPLACALNISDPVVHSAIGQPLDAEFPLQLSPEDWESIQDLTVRFGSPEDYAQYGYVETSFVRALKLSLQQDPEFGMVVQVSSLAPVVEPNIPVVVVVGTEGNTIVKGAQILPLFQSVAGPLSEEEPPITDDYTKVRVQILEQSLASAYEEQTDLLREYELLLKENQSLKAQLAEHQSPALPEAEKADTPQVTPVVAEKRADPVDETGGLPWGMISLLVLLVSALLGYRWAQQNPESLESLKNRWRKDS